MENSFESHTDNLKKNLNSIQNYMKRFKGSIMGDFDDLIDSALAVVDGGLPFKDIALQYIEENDSYKHLSREELANKEYEINTKGTDFTDSMLKLSEALYENNQLVKMKSEENYEEVRIHLYSLFVYIIAIFEDYLKKILKEDKSLNDLIISIDKSFQMNKIAGKNWTKEMRGFKKIRNEIVHSIGDINSNEDLYVTMDGTIRPLLHTIDEFIYLYRSLLKKTIKF